MANLLQTRINRLIGEHLLSSAINKNTVTWKKGEHGKYSVEVRSGKYSTQYMKILWKLQYEFADARINWFT